MIKVILAGVWGCVVTLTAVYFTHSSNAKLEPEVAHDERPQQLVKLKPITVPVVAAEGVVGYILAMISISVDEAAIKKRPPDLEAVLHDVAFRTLYGIEAVRYRKPRKTDLEDLSKSILAAMNDRIGPGSIKEVLLQEFSFVAKDQARKPK